MTEIKIKKAFPAKMGMQLHKLENLVEFECDRCKKIKKSKSAATSNDWSTVICNGCYGETIKLNQINL